jgi:hypothetical protein
MLATSDPAGHNGCENLVELSAFSAYATRAASSAFADFGHRYSIYRMNR